MSASPLKIEQKIVGWSVNEIKEEELPPVIVYDRDAELEGTTYKIKPVPINCALYVTINHVTLPDGTKRPLEIFLNSKHTEHHQWMVALTRMVSAVFRKPGDIEFAIEELEGVFDPAGGYWVDGDMCPSIVAHVGKVIRKHCLKIGAIKPRELTQVQKEVIAEKQEKAEELGVDMQRCSVCHENTVIMLDGCLTCTSCGDSKCN